MEDKTFTVSPPYPRVEVRLPGNGGVLKGHVKALTERRGGETWVQVVVPTWSRWRTQVEVGQPAREGIAPGEQTMWAPGFAVTGDSDDIERIQHEYRQGLKAN